MQLRFYRTCVRRKIVFGFLSIFFIQNTFAYESPEHTNFQSINPDRGEILLENLHELIKYFCSNKSIKGKLRKENCNPEKFKASAQFPSGSWKANKDKDERMGRYCLQKGVKVPFEQSTVEKSLDNWKRAYVCEPDRGKAINTSSEQEKLYLKDLLKANLHADIYEDLFTSEGQNNIYSFLTESSGSTDSLVTLAQKLVNNKLGQTQNDGLWKIMEDLNRNPQGFNIQSYNELAHKFENGKELLEKIALLEETFNRYITVKEAYCLENSVRIQNSTTETQGITNTIREAAQNTGKISIVVSQVHESLRGVLSPLDHGDHPELYPVVNRDAKIYYVDGSDGILGHAQKFENMFEHFKDFYDRGCGANGSGMASGSSNGNGSDEANGGGSGGGRDKNGSGDDSSSKKPKGKDAELKERLARCDKSSGALREDCRQAVREEFNADKELKKSSDGKMTTPLVMLGVGGVVSAVGLGSLLKGMNDDGDDDKDPWGSATAVVSMGMTQREAAYQRKVAHSQWVRDYKIQCYSLKGVFNEAAERCEVNPDILKEVNCNQSSPFAMGQSQYDQCPQGTHFVIVPEYQGASQFPPGVNGAPLGPMSVASSPLQSVPMDQVPMGYTMVPGYGCERGAAYGYWGTCVSDAPILNTVPASVTDVVQTPPNNVCQGNGCSNNNQSGGANLPGGVPTGTGSVPCTTKGSLPLPTPDGSPRPGCGSTSPPTTPTSPPTQTTPEPPVPTNTNPTPTLAPGSGNQIPTINSGGGQ